MKKKKKNEKGCLLIVAKRMLFSSSDPMKYMEEEKNSAQGSRAKEAYLWGFSEEVRIVSGKNTRQYT